MRIRHLPLFLLFVTPLFGEVSQGRFFLEGDGVLNLARSKKARAERFWYRSAEGNYSDEALKKINGAFGLPTDAEESISLRLITLLDHLEDHFKAKKVALISGFRNQGENEQLRSQGFLAGSVSLHLDGMAADVEFKGVSSRAVWEYLRSLNCCGAGYYHGGSVHLDTGPARFWDEKTSGVEKGPPPPNKMIMVRTDKDLYKVGERIRFQLARVQAYPFGIDSHLVILKEGKRIQELKVEGAESPCISVQDRRGRFFSGILPAPLQSEGPVQVQIRFCENNFPEMPPQIESNPIRIDLLKEIP